MELKTAKKESETLASLSAFIESTKSGEFSKQFPEIQSVSFGRSEIPEEIESVLMQIEPYPVLYFGLSS